MKPARSFTLLEVMLASLLGGLVIVACLGMFSTIERTDKRSRSRFEQTMALSTIQTVMRRATFNLLMEEGTRPVVPVQRTPGSPGLPGTPPPPAPLSPSDKGGSAPGRAGDNQPDNTPLQPPHRPRFLLENVTGSDGAMAVKGGNGGVVPVSAQRLELVLSTPPVYSREQPGEIVGDTRPVSRANRHRRAAGQRHGILSAGGAPAPGQDLQTDSQRAPGVRGAFELTPDTSPTRGGKQTWALWWRTIPPPPDEDQGASDAGADDSGSPVGGGKGGGGADRQPRRDRTQPAPTTEVQVPEPVKIADGLVTCHWDVYYQEKTLPEIAGVWAEDVPAYITLEVETSGGLWGKWMFEVWPMRGPEPGTRLVQAAGGVNQPAGGVVSPDGRTRTGGRPGGPASPTRPRVGPTGATGTTGGSR